MVSKVSFLPLLLSLGICYTGLHPLTAVIVIRKLLYVEWNRGVVLVRAHDSTKLEWVPPDADKSA